MHDESVHRDPERAFAAFLDRLATGEPGADGVDPALAETARDLHDRAARSTVSAPPTGTLASIRADLFREPAAQARHRAALGLVPFPALLTRPATQIALAAAILLALVTGFTAFRGTGWLGHTPTSTHTAFAASATAPVTTSYAISADAENTTAYAALGTVTGMSSPTSTLSPEAQTLVATCPMPTGTRIPQEEEFFTPWGLGKAPLWLAGWSNPPTELQSRFPGPYAAFTGHQFAGPTAYGWFMRSLWVMDQANTEPVTLRGQRTSDGARMLFDVTYGHLDATVTLDPANPGIPVQHGGYREWPGNIYVPGSGCYELTAIWQGGSWTVQLPIIVPTAPSRCATDIASNTTAQAVYPGTPADFAAPTCAPPGGSSTPKAATSQSATPIASPSAATPSASTTCAMPDATSVNIPVTRDGQLVNVAGLGTSPLWLVGLGQRPAWYPATDPGFSVTPGVTIGGTPAPPAGTIDHVLWLMPTDNLMSVTVTGQNVLTGQRLVFQTLDASMRSNETTTAVFNPAADPLSTRFGAARLWWTGIIYPQPGCYEITATWASGSWTIRLPLPPPTGEAVAPACATPGTGATPGVLQTPGAPAHLLTQPRPPLATVQPGPPGLTPGIQQIATRPGVPLITPTPFATVIGVATPAGTPGVGCRGG